DIRAPGLSDTPILAPKPAQFRSVGAARYWPLEVRLVLLADGRSFDTIQHPAVSVGQDVEDAGPVDSHIANAPELMMEEMPLGQDAVFIEGEFCNHLAGERSYPDFGSPRLGRDGERTRRNRYRYPITNRQLGAGLFAVDRDRPSRIVDAVGGERPAVIAAAVDEVELVSALRPVLVGPQLSRHLVEGKALRISVAEAPDFRSGRRLLAERIIVGNGPVAPDAHDAARCVGQILGLGGIPAIAERQKKKTIWGQGHPAAEHFGLGVWRSFEDDLLLGEHLAVLIEPRPHDLDARRRLVAL